MSAQSSLHSSRCPSPASASPVRVVLSPADASWLMQSLLQDPTDQGQTRPPPPPDAGATAVSAAIATTSSNTVDRDFFLFGANEPSFDYPLFDENKQLQLQLQLRQMRQMPAAVDSNGLSPAAPVLALPPPPSAPSPTPTPSSTLSSTHSNSTSNNPLCTPQTPSLDFFCSTIPNPSAGTATSSLSNMASPSEPTSTFGFDGLAAFLDDTSVDALSMNQHQLNLVTGHDSVAFEALLVQQQQQQLHHHQQQQLREQPLIDSPGSPYLQTPFQTPYLQDFGLAMMPLDSGCASAIVLDLDSPLSSMNHRQGFDSLFQEYDYGLLAQLEPTFGGQHTISPGTLHMTPGHGCAPPGVYSSDDDDLSLLSTTSEQSLSPKIEGTLALSSEEGEPLFSEEDGEEEEEEQEDDDDDEFVPSRPLALAVARFKRKALDKFQSNAATTSPTFAEIKAEGECVPSPSKRTRPTLASPSGGKAIIRLRLKSNASSAADTGDSSQPAPKPKKRRIRKPNPSRLTAPKRFTCPHEDCDLQFARLYNLRSHQKTHDPDPVRPFVCSFDPCTKAFSRKHDLQRHEAAVHKGERNYGCSICSKPFSRLDGLRRHLSLTGNNSCAALAAASADAVAVAEKTSSQDARDGDDLDEDIDPGMETGWTAS
ncbi:hypothetical protein EMPS_06969 [Entomortierella parvispora]|uniref:C2H2-type domain-containing protein n=1 Tax=Entomortierella parvispora TaxID=205924 RepID=A0A9P3HDI2_9FUNG|nr:hypothetical protein EMPS_06969 [Entomortierella parvispora]